MCYPKGAHSITHRWLQLLTFGAFWIQFQIFNVLPQGGSFKTPPFRKLLTFWAFWIKLQIFNVLPKGGSFDYPPLAAITHFWDILDYLSMCFPKEAHSFTRLRGLQFPTFGFKVSFAQFPGHRRRNNYLWSTQWEDSNNCMSRTSWTPLYMQIWPIFSPSRPEAQKKSFAEQMTHTMRRLNALFKTS